MICERISRAVDMHRKSLKCVPVSKFATNLETLRTGRWLSCFPCFLRFMDFVFTTFAIPLCVLVVIGVASISLNLFRVSIRCTSIELSRLSKLLSKLYSRNVYIRISQPQSTWWCTGVIILQLLQPATIKNTTDLITSIVLLIGHFAYMFLANYFAQTVTDHSADIFDATWVNNFLNKWKQNWMKRLDFYN